MDTSDCLMSKVGESNLGTEQQPSIHNPYFKNAAFIALCGFIFLLLAIFHINAVVNSTASFLSGAMGKRQCQWSLIRDNYELLPHFNSSLSSYLNYKFLDKVDALIEPHAPTALHWNGEESVDFSFGRYDSINFSVCALDVANSTGFACVWGVYDVANRNSSIFVIECLPMETYEVTVFVSDVGGRTKSTKMFTAICSYVRREIRSLSTEDLNKTMNAMATLWHTREAPGQVMYGPNFHNITYFTLGHYFSASQRNADHIHQGLGKAFVRFNLLSLNVFLSRYECMLPPRQRYNVRFATASCHINCPMLLFVHTNRFPSATSEVLQRI